MEQLALALVAFIGSHELLSHPLRKPIAGKIGEAAFQGVYSLVALATFVWVVLAFRAAPADFLWAAPPWVWAVASLVMLVAAILFAGSLLSPNPALPMQAGLLAGGPAPQGVMRITRHPMMWSFALWAAVHLAVSGNSRAVLLAAGLGFLALFGARMQDRKKGQQLGAGWTAYEARTSFVPFGRGFALPGWKATIGGLVIFLAATWAHPKLGAPVVGVWSYL